MGLSREEMGSILVFERVVGDWVREVHMFTSKSKKGKNFVIFRNGSNTKLKGSREFSAYLTANGFDTSFLNDAAFKSDQSKSIDSNKAGANILARKEAAQWVEDVQNSRVEKLVSGGARSGLHDPHLCNSAQPSNTRQVDTTVATLGKQNGNIKTNNNNERKSPPQSSSQSQEIVETSEVEKKIDDCVNDEMETNTNTYWVRNSKVEMEEPDKAMIMQTKLYHAKQLDLGTIDYNWMEAFESSDAKEEDSTATEEEVIFNTFEKTSCGTKANREWNISNKEKDTSVRKQDNIKVGQMDNVLMDAIGGISVEEDEENNSRNIKREEKKVVDDDRTD